MNLELKPKINQIKSLLYSSNQNAMLVNKTNQSNYNLLAYKNLTNIKIEPLPDFESIPG